MPITVTLLTRSDCDYCEQAQGVLNRLSTEFGLQVDTVDMGDSRGRSLAEASQLVFPPGVFIDGELFCHGRLSERKLRRYLRDRST